MQWSAANGEAGHGLIPDEQKRMSALTSLAGATEITLIYKPAIRALYLRGFPLLLSDLRFRKSSSPSIVLNTLEGSRPSVLAMINSVKRINRTASL